MSTRHLTSFMLLIAVVTAIVVSCWRFDFSMVIEIRALLTLIFSFSTLCLILSFVWLINKRPLYTAWPTMNTSSLDSPSMHPRGRLDSIGSRDNICTISALLDPPPDYDDALNNSKPINWSYLLSEKSNLSAGVQQSPSSSAAPHYNQHQLLVRQLGNSHSCPESREHLLNQQSSANDCYICMDNTDAKNKQQARRSSSVAQLAINLVLGFTTPQQGEGELQHQVSSRSRRTSQPPATRRHTVYRKLSYCQLDVSQLVLASSPPKYCDLALSEENLTDAHNINGIRARDQS